MTVMDEELARIPRQERLDEARQIFDEVALSEEFVDFLTLPAYSRLD